MKIADLHYLESISSETPIRVSGSAGVVVGVFGEAVGETTSTQADTRSLAIALPNDGSLAIGIGHVVAIARTLPSP